MGTAWLNWPVSSTARRAGDKVCVTAPEKAAAPLRQKTPNILTWWWPQRNTKVFLSPVQICYRRTSHGQSGHLVAILENPWKGWGHGQIQAFMRHQNRKNINSSSPVILYRRQNQKHWLHCRLFLQHAEGWDIQHVIFTGMDLPIQNDLTGPSLQRRRSPKTQICIFLIMV